MTDYTKATNFAVKDGLPSGNPAKLIKGTEIDTEFTAIQTAVASKADEVNPSLSGTVTLASATTISTNGVTVSDVELGYVDGVTSNIQTQLNAKQASDAELTAIAGLTSAADQVPYFTGSGTAALTTVTAAARTVLDDTTTGAMLVTLGAAASGANTNITSLGGISAGSAASPTISTTGDTNTGIFFPAADTVAVATGGAEKLRVNSNVQIGFNTTPNAGWGAAIPAWQLSNVTSCYQITGVSVFTNNVYTDGTNAKLATAAAASAVVLNGNSATLQNYSSGAADSNISLIASFGLDGNGNATLTTAVGGLGYGTGAGGTVTQATSRTTGVTINKPTGSITLVSAAGSTSWQTFQVSNSLCAATDTPIVVQKSGTDLYEIHVTAVAAGSFNVTFRTTAGTTTEQPVFSFNLIKGVAA